MPSTIKTSQIKGNSQVKPRVSTLSNIFKTLSNPTRLAIIDLLKQGELCVCEFVNVLKLPQNLLSHHLSVLRRHGIVKDRRDDHDSRWIYYSINKEALAVLDRRCHKFFDADTIVDRKTFCTRDGTPFHKRKSTGKLRGL